MNDAALESDPQDIVVDEVFPHAPETIWKALTAGELIARWLMMPTTGFEPVKGKRFTFQTTPTGAWDGVIHCQVLEAMPNERLVYAWKGGQLKRVYRAGWESEFGGRPGCSTGIDRPHATSISTNRRLTMQH
jgi:uncharacterized protein YndB with AHSA1/START domain